MCSAAAGKDKVTAVGLTDVVALTGSTLTSNQPELVFEPGDLEQAQGRGLRATQTDRILRPECLTGPDQRTQARGVDEADLAKVDDERANTSPDEVIDGVVDILGRRRVELAHQRQDALLALHLVTE